MTSFNRQLLVSVTVIVSLSFSQENREENVRGGINSNVNDKQINVKEFIRFGGKRGDKNGETAKNKVPVGNSLFESSLTSMSSLLTKAYDVAGLKEMEKSGLQSLDKTENNTGTAFVCGPEGAHLNISWVPRVIDPNKPVKIFIDIINPIDFNNGQIHLDVYVDGSPTPLFSMAADFDCTYIKSFIPFAECPLKKGARQTLSFLCPVSILDKAPYGNFTAVVKVVSYEGNSHPLFACLNITLQIVPSKPVFPRYSSEIVGHL